MSKEISLRPDIAQQIIFRLREALEKAKTSHTLCEDTHYSCPKSGECTREWDNEECDCGADQHNKAIDEALKGRKL
ncbi:hypothetical protein LCGC14_3125290 [marine sediment metagenome]|uniref:Uncharacterized protein n=1 Tax=marine sediment metagenome TaxID=412755 RepID=A0A0F8WQ27_9ZZZZ